MVREYKIDEERLSKFGEAKLKVFMSYFQQIGPDCFQMKDLSVIEDITNEKPIVDSVNSKQTSLAIQNHGKHRK